MDASVTVNRSSPVAWISAGLGGYALVGSLLTLVGWGLDFRRLTDWDNNGISQMPNNALGVAAAGAAIVLLSFGQRRVGAVLGGFACLLGAATFSQYLTGLDLGIDTLLVTREWGQRGSVVPGRMGPPGSTSLAIIGLSIILTCFSRTRRFAVVGGLLTASIAMLSLVGHLFDADSLYTLPKLTVIAFQTSTMLLALGLALVISVPECQPMKTLLGESAAALLVQRALPGVILLPIALGWLLVRGQETGLFDTAFGTALLVLVLIALLTTLLWWSSAAVRVHETAMREGRERLSGILGSITDAFYTLDKDWRFAFVNDETVRRFGRPRDQIVGKNLWELFPEAVGNKAHRQLQRAMSERVPVEYEEFYPPWQRWFAGRAYPTADGGLAVYSQDVTDRKRAEEQLRASEETLRRNHDTFFSLIENAPFGLYVVDDDFRLRQVSAASRKVFRNVRPLIGRDFAEILRIIWPEPFASEVVRRFRHTLATGEPYVATNTTERRHDTPEVEAYDWRIERIALPDGRPGVVCYFYDLTDRKRAEERLRESEERMQLAMNIAHAATWDLDLIAEANHWSDSHFALLGYEPTPDRLATAEMWQGAVVAEDLPKVLAEWERAEREHDTFRSEHRLRRAQDGRIIWVNSAGRFFHNAAGKPVRFVGVFYDITERKRNEDELRRLSAELRDADRRKDEFLATLAHELRNPLAPIRNSLEVVKRAAGNTEMMDRARSTMERQMAHMVRLIDDLLDVSRITRDKLVLRTERVELASIIHHAVEACASLVSAANHELTVALPTEPIYVSADPARLAQVFGNFLTNACKYTEPRGRIWLTVERHGSDVVASIKDTGLGIPPDMLPNVFEMFTQVDRTLERSQGGLGIGLTLVKRLVELHQGTVTAHSDGQGRGSEFVVRLPVLLDMPNPDFHFKPPAELGPTPARRILVVDDNRDAALSLAMLLELTGNEVHTAHDGVEGVEQAVAFKPDAILLDIGLPRMNGYDACRMIRKQPGGTEIVMVALTGWGQEEDRRKSQEAGFDGHLVKPVDHSALLALLGANARSEENQLAKRSS